MLPPPASASGQTSRFACGRPSLFMALVFVISIGFLLAFLQFETLQQRVGRRVMDNDDDSMEERLERLEEAQNRLEQTIMQLFPALNERFALQNDRLAKILKGEPEPTPFTNTLTITNKTKHFVEWLERYAQEHKEAMEGRRKDAKYVRCIGYNGYGNIFQSVVPCALFALASNRVMQIDLVGTGWDYEDYFAKPPIEHQKLSVLFGKEKEEIDAEDLICADDYLLFEKKEVLELNGNWGFDYFGQSLQLNPLWNLSSTLPIDWYRILFNWLFPLKTRLQERVEAWKRIHFGDYTIGIQIRTPILKTHDGSWYKGKADHEGHPVPPISLFAQTAELLSRQQEEGTGIPFSRVKWFLATQNTSVKDDLARQYGLNKVAFFEGKIITTFDPDREGQEVAFLTWWLLGECNDIITTESSSYGISAAARGGLRAVVCNHGRFCSRKLTPQPCQQTPWNEKGTYPIKPVQCADNSSVQWRSVESSCAYFEAIIRRDPNYKKGNAW